MLYEDVKVICEVMCNKKVVCWFRCFILAPCYNLTIMMESVFSFLPSYLFSIFLAKGEISKSAGLFLRNIGPKQCWPITLPDFKSNISLEQSNEIVYFFTCWYQKLRVDRKILGWCGQKWLWPSWSQGEWMNEWINWADFSCWCK